MPELHRHLANKCEDTVNLQGAEALLCRLFFNSSRLKRLRTKSDMLFCCHTVFVLFIYYTVSQKRK